MSKEAQKLKGYLSRLLSNDFIALRSYQYWAIGVFVIFGVIGIFSVSKAIYQKIPLMIEMQRINSDLSQKASELAELEKVLTDVSDDLIFLRNYLPDNFDIQNYMIDFVIASARSGFLVERFIPREEKDSVVEISVYLSGQGDLASLVGELESMDRITEILSIDYNRELSEDRIRMIVNTFGMKKQ
ncbi:type 4a pilus biogenesis protein PilO [Patescibacteria group bacterium]